MDKYTIVYPFFIYIICLYKNKIIWADQKEV